VDGATCVEQVCKFVCEDEEDEDGICKAGIEIGITEPMGGAIKDEDDKCKVGIEVGVCNPVGRAREDEDGIYKAGIDGNGLGGMLST